MIRSAGGVLWRPTHDGVEVALVHRPRYDDWSLPKGKTRGDEHALLAASREVRETGIRPVRGPRLPIQRYRTPDGSKVVEYWAMRGHGGGFTASTVVDGCHWLPVLEARARMIYPDDARLLDALSGLDVADAVVMLVRHASAGDPKRWTGDDTLRALDGRGQDQAEALRRVLPLFAPTRLLSVGNRRCRDTFTPLATNLGLPVEPEQTLEERHDADQSAVGLRRVRQFAASGGVIVVCSQGTVIPHLVAALAAQDGLIVSDVRAKKGSVLGVTDAG